MKITQLNIYPIKSLRPISLDTANLCPQGLANDRNYILLKLSQNGTYTNMFIGQQPEMALFHCSPCTPHTFTVTYHLPSSLEPPPSIEIPYTPSLASLKQISIDLHTNPSYPAHLMPPEYNLWFTTHFTYPVHLAYIDSSPGTPSTSPLAQSWLSTIKPHLPSPAQEDEENITFSDGAALLIVSSASLSALPLLHEPSKQEQQSTLLEKFRPNIVLSAPDLAAWDEDFWSCITVQPKGIKIVLTSNCARCTSINVDLRTGEMTGSLLKSMMGSRRVDPGKRWEPIFGRYGFAVRGGEVTVGDEVTVERVGERAVWSLLSLFLLEKVSCVDLVRDEY
ncbi:uncharacterized protein LY89DRAFT_686804 [Mollisia scopiformis]|uniref:MOSC domain-containing protein n=1 Tax=Mollisia scopiformis TaxID=149040 RepID=A0A194X2B5_MOLSC|nr:uncharacterized protein LY89DRAFT_686804 [Mollisia scopiformis]KUJ14318.1 hypothetical protein LY89DRAFT_686804 [Mollisia scopiformis]